MNYTVELLLNGDGNVVEYYQNAKELWSEILAKNSDFNIDKLAEDLGYYQMIFEKKCGGRWEGQEIMVVVGIAQFYTTTRGFEENMVKAKSIYEAFRKSFCSLEVKACAENVAKQYYLLEE